MTYSSLLSSVTDYLERQGDSKLAAMLPTFVMLAENRVAARLKIIGNQLVVTGALVSGNEALAKPAFWRDTVSLRVNLSNGRRKVIKLRTYEFCRSMWPSPGTMGEPRYYADYNATNFLIVPTPDSAYPLELVYHARLEPLDTTNQTNWFTDQAPQALFYATLAEAQIWLKNPDKIQQMFDLFENAASLLTGEETRRVMDRTAMVR